MCRLKQDDTLTKLGDIYHYLLVVKSCFELKEREKIFVEQYGDISKKSSDDSYQMEVKHHKDKVNFSDRNSEFWNTIKNWLESKASINEFRKLLLLTTSKINETSSFYKWDEKSVDERYDTLLKIGSVEKEREKQFRDLYNKVFDYDEEEIKDVLGKIYFIDDQPNVSDIKSSIKNYLFIVPEKKHDLFIASIIGYILDEPTHPPYKWEITYDNFRSLVNELRDDFTYDGLRLPNTYQDMEVDNYDSYKDRKFVSEIKRIKYEKQINNAINDVWRTNNTIIEYFNENYIFKKDLKTYKNELNRELDNLKEEHILNCEDNEEKTRIQNAKKFYIGSMRLPATSFGIVKNNWKFFKNGIIHEIVDEGQIYWYIEEEENE